MSAGADIPPNETSRPLQPRGTILLGPRIFGALVILSYVWRLS